VTSFQNAQVGDTILKVDKKEVTMEDYESALLGCDVPGSRIQLSILKPDGREVDVTLSRMARNEMADSMKMFEYFTTLEEFIANSGDEHHARVMDDTIELYTKMQEKNADRDMTIVHNVLEMQQHSSALLQNLKDKLHALHKSFENHIAGYGDQIMELQVESLVFWRV
jgi:hypothetical protein